MAGRDEQRLGKSKNLSFIHSRIISIISIAMVLFLVGVVAIIGLIGTGLKDYVRESFNFTVLITPEASNNEIALMKKDIEKHPFVKEVEYYSKEEAIKQLTEELGESPESFLGWNPLSPTLEVYVKSKYVSEKDSIAKIERLLGNYPITQSVSFRKDLIEALNKNIRTVTIVMIVLTVILLLISVVLINNTVRLLIYSKRFLIYTMRLVGATAGFIRRPFVWSNIWAGVAAAVLAIALLAWGRWYVLDVFPPMREVLTIRNSLIVSGIVLVLGVLISWIASALAVSRYLRMDADKLYRA